MRYLVVWLALVLVAFTFLALVVTGLSEEVPPQDDPERMDEYE
jgi:hypothetical protein